MAPAPPPWHTHGVRALLGSAIVAVVGCGSSSGPAAPTPSAPPAAGPGPIAVAPADRACTADADCTAILTACSMCEGACTGVRADRAARYDGRLACTGYTGALCNYDCRPSFGIEEPRCVAGRCESVRPPR